MTQFATPWALLLLLAPLALLLVRKRRRVRPAILLPSQELAAPIRPTFRQRSLWLVPSLRAVCLTLLAVAIARPQEGFGIVQTSADAVAIEIVVDRSGSMAEPMEFEGRRLSRFQVVKLLFRDFVMGDGRDLPGRPFDPIGLVTFARFAETICPLTRAHDALTDLMEQTDMVRYQAEDGTAIGDAIALAAARLKDADKALAEHAQLEPPDADSDAKPGDAPSIKSKVIILLTDGRNNAGEFTPIDAARLAAQWGVKIYAIGIGESRQTFMRSPLDAFRLSTSGVDEDMLRQVAEITGGRAWIASNAAALRQVYEQIDQLEKTEIRSIEYTNYDEKFTPFAAAALAALALEALLATTILRRSP